MPEIHRVLTQTIAALVFAVAIHPLYEKLVKVLRGRDKLAAILVTIIFLVLLMVPTIMLTKLLAENVAS